MPASMDVLNSQKALLVDDKDTVLLNEGIIDNFSRQQSHLIMFYFEASVVIVNMAPSWTVKDNWDLVWVTLFGLLNFSHPLCFEGAAK